MSGWVRLWEDMPTDPKWRVVARKSGQTIPAVIAVFTMLMVEGGKSGRSGDVSGARAEDIAAALDMDDAAVDAILEAMQGRVIEGSSLSGWDKRQPKREDNSTQRVQAHRERYKAGVKRAETQCNAPEADSDTEKNISNADALGADAPTAPTYADAKHELWGEGKPMLESLGIKAPQCGKMIGQWLKATGDDHAGVLDAIQRAREARPHDPIPWITRALPTKANHDRASRQARPDPRPSGTQRALAGLAQAAAERPDSRLFALDTGGAGFGRGPTGDGGGNGGSSGCPPLRLIDG